MQHSTREGAIMCPGAGECKQERKSENTDNREKAEESDKGAACKRRKAHAKEGKYTTERACM